MPDERVLSAQDPVVLIGEVEHAAWDATALKDVENADTVRDGETEVSIVVDDELGSGEGKDILGGRWIEAIEILTSVPESAVKLGSY